MSSPKPVNGFKTQSNYDSACDSNRKISNHKPLLSGPKVFGPVVKPTDRGTEGMINRRYIVPRLLLKGKKEFKVVS